MFSPGARSLKGDGGLMQDVAQKTFEQFRHLSKAFKAADTNNSGYLDSFEVMKLCTRFDVTGTEVTPACPQ